MARNNHDQDAIRRYLLRQLTDDAQQEFEQRLLMEEEVLEELEIAEDELIDEHLAGSLGQEEQDRFERYFLVTPERTEKLRFAQTLKKYVSTNTRPQPMVLPIKSSAQSWWRPAIFTSPWAVAAMVLILLGAGAAVWRGVFYQSDVDKGLLALNAAYREQRPTQARISGLTAYAPHPITRGDPDHVDNTARDRARAVLQLAASEHPDARSLHALGLLYLTDKEFDKALEQFNKALALDSNNAQIHADLGAAMLEKGKVEIERGQADKNTLESGKGTEDLAASLESLNKALQLNPNLLEALFNRAMVYQTMPLREKAIEAWHKYLEGDSTSLWAGEARQYLKLLEERPSKTKERLIKDFLLAFETRDDEAAWTAFRQSRARTGNLISEALLDDYLELSTKGQTEEASQKLSQLSYISSLDKQRSGDQLNGDINQFYKDATLAQRKLVIEARLEKTKANEKFNVPEYDDAIELYSKARDLFAQAGDQSEALLAEAGMGFSYLRIPNPDKSLEIFEPLSRTSETRSYKSLLALSLIAISDAWTSRNEFSKALDYAGRCVSLAEQIGDDTTAARGIQQFVSSQLAFGSYRESLGLTLEGLARADNGLPDPKLKWPFYHEAALAFHRLGFPSSAVAFEEEAARLAMLSGNVLLKSRSWERLGLIYEQTRNFAEAIKYAELALAEAKNISGGKLRLNLLAHASLNLGHLHRKTEELAKAISYYDQSLDLYNQLGLDIYLYQAHKGKLLALIGLKSDTATAEELTTVLELFEKHRAQILEESNRDKFFDLDQDTYDTAIDFSYSRSNGPAEALRYAEASRARSLNELMSTGARVSESKGVPDLQLGEGSQALTPDEIRTQIPEQAQVLEYAVLDDKVVIWVVTKKAINSETTSVGAADLDQQVQEFFRALSQSPVADRDALIRQAQDLHDKLISPVEKYLDKQLRLCIVPDKGLNYLPFEALVSRASGHYLIEDYTLQRAPSSSIFIQSSMYAKLRDHVQDERLLSVGNPTFDRTEFSSLPALPAAERESDQIAGYYRRALSLTGKRATAGRVRPELAQADVIHFATHAVLDERSPLLSRLLLAREAREDAHANGSNGVLRVADIYETKLPRTRLVVLSACQTGIERAYRGEGAIGMARPFIAARVPLVVASLWPVESATTADLMINFHRYRKVNHLPTVEALRQAQLDQLRSQGTTPTNYGWAAFTTIGGNATF